MHGAFHKGCPSGSGSGIGYVQSGSDSTLVQSLHQRFRFDNRPPRCIQQQRPGLHPRQELGVKNDDAFPKLTEWSGPQCRQTATLGPGCSRAQPLHAQYVRCERTWLRTEKAALRSSSDRPVSDDWNYGIRDFMHGRRRILDPDGVRDDDRSGSTAARESTSLLSAGQRKMACFLHGENCINRPFRRWECRAHPARRTTSARTPDDSRRQRRNPEVDFDLFLGS